MGLIQSHHSRERNMSDVSILVIILPSKLLGGVEFIWALLHIHGRQIFFFVKANSLPRSMPLFLFTALLSFLCY
jgi:hypothetical protein